MPLLRLETTVLMSEDKRKAVLTALSKIMAGTVMVSTGQAAMLMSGKTGEAAFVDIRSIGGLTNDVNRKLSQQVCKVINDALGIPPDRVYLNFADVDASKWGWNGSTFG